MIAPLALDGFCFSGALSLPPLTSIDANAAHVGYRAARLLARLMDGGAAPAGVRAEG